MPGLRRFSLILSLVPGLRFAPAGAILFLPLRGLSKKIGQSRVERVLIFSKNPIYRRCEPTQWAWQSSLDAKFWMATSAAPPRQDEKRKIIGKNQQSLEDCPQRS